jgi:hypothetical protein
MANVIEVLVADSWGSGFSVACMFVVTALAVYQFMKVSVKSGVATLAVGIILVNGLLALVARLL